MKTPPKHRDPKPKRQGLIRPGGRSERTRHAVATATLDLIKSGKLDFDIKEVARLAGVHRTTIHRRWPDRAALVAAALVEHNSRIDDLVFTGDWRADIRRTAFALRDFLAEPVEVAMNTLLAMPDSGELRAQAILQWRPFMSRFEQPIRNAQARGDIGPQADAAMLMAMMVSTITTSIIFTKVIPDDAFIERLVAQIANACVDGTADSDPPVTHG
ncbi:MAG: TetR/AcrR family transcriptional regulator C-terminal ligand-binding domain-containing protein [Halioglobus sp.]|nr:TetR/AcrR family transcriptional regulator C-terminal ligand-binding domain-containing protein [Halioglobus sp.]